MTAPTDVRTEIATIRRIVAALEKLDPSTRGRVVRYLVDRYESERSMPPVDF